VGKGPNSGTWYLAQAADGAWRMHARMEAELSPIRVLAELSGYPAVITTNGNLFHLGTPLTRLVNLRSH
jgi:hypothetical protein